MKGIDPINFMLMANTIKLENDAMLYKVYDLKGSLANRYTSREGASTMKDQNLMSTKRYRLNKNIKRLLVFEKDHIKKIM